MKKTIIILALIAGIAILNSCKKDSSGNPIIASMSAKVDLNNWSSIIRTATINGNTLSVNGTSLGGEIIQITASPAGSESLTTNVNYSLSLTSFYKKSATASTDDAYFAVSGTVKLTQLDYTNKLISGTFSFSASSISFGLAAVTNGEFTNVSFVVL